MDFKDKLNELDNILKSLGRFDSHRAIKFIVDVYSEEIEIRDKRISELEFKLKLLLEGVATE